MKIGLLEPSEVETDPLITDGQEIAQTDGQKIVQTDGNKLLKSVTRERARVIFTKSIIYL